MNTTGIILAGGKSTRMGRDKAMEPVLGTQLIRRVFDSLKPLAEQVLVVTSRGLVSLPYPEETDVVTDIYPDKGPLSGIYTGLASARYDYSIVVGCDMPFLNKKLLAHMLEECRDFDAVVPRLSPSTLEPLHAVYSRSCLKTIKAQLEKGVLQIRLLFNEMNVKYIGLQECRLFDPGLLSFFNVNSQADLDKTIALTQQAKNEGEC
jgi:molybdopterin-guanine dinucleotide biosynthesis protein A